MQAARANGAISAREAAAMFKSQVKAFAVAVGTRQIDRAAALQESAMRLVVDVPGVDWAAHISTAFKRATFPASDFFGGHGRRVAALYSSESRLALIEQAQRALPPEQNGIDVDGVREDAQIVDRARDLLRDSLPLATKQLLALLSSAGFGRSRWFVDWLERNGEIRTIDDVVSWVVAGERTTMSNRTVPPFQRYYATYADMDSHQRTFFMEEFKPRFLAGDMINLEGNVSYAFVLLHDMLRKRVKYSRELPRCLALAEVLGRGTSLAHYANGWLADLDLLDKKWEPAFETMERVGLRLDMVLARTLVLPDRRLTVDEVSGLMGGQNGFGAVGQKRPEEVRTVVQFQLDRFHETNGRTLLSDVWHRIVDHIEGDQPLAWDPEEGEPYIDEFRATDKLANTRRLWKTPTDPAMRAFFGVPGIGNKLIDWPVKLPETQAGFAYQVFAERLRAEFRRAENAVRDQLGIARVGEGWVSEVNLFHQLRDAFPDIRVRHQGRPRWLGRQSLDIFLPDYNVGIEYQGLQHAQPVTFFGGDETFAAQQERDARKQALCLENDCILIEVFPNYTFAQVERQVQVAIDSRPAWYLGRDER
jgi:hypothetical protein